LLHCSTQLGIKDVDEDAPNALDKFGGGDEDVVVDVID